AVVGIVAAFSFALAWLSAAIGLVTKSVAGANGSTLPLSFLLPFLSITFVPADSMPVRVRWYAANQPFTPVVDSLRSLLTGVPLGRVKALLAADPDQVAAAMAEIDRSLEMRVRELRRTRQRIARLSGGDRLFVSAEVADYLDDLRELGVSERGVRLERDGWILLQSVSPKNAAVWIAEKRAAIGDPEFRALYLEYDSAYDWSRDDPRLPSLAERAQRSLVKRPDRVEGGPPPRDPALVQ